jgi:hypothetical protein
MGLKCWLGMHETQDGRCARCGYDEWATQRLQAKKETFRSLGMLMISMADDVLAACGGLTAAAGAPEEKYLADLWRSERPAVSRQPWIPSELESLSTGAAGILGVTRRREMERHSGEFIERTARWLEQISGPPGDFQAAEPPAAWLSRAASSFVRIMLAAPTAETGR